jgi:hypothetical protein
MVKKGCSGRLGSAAPFFPNHRQPPAPGSMPSRESGLAAWDRLDVSLWTMIFRFATLVRYQTTSFAALHPPPASRPSAFLKLLLVCRAWKVSSFDMFMASRLTSSCLCWGLGCCRAPDLHPHAYRTPSSPVTGGTSSYPKPFTRPPNPSHDDSCPWK